MFKEVNVLFKGTPDQQNVKMQQNVNDKNAGKCHNEENVTGSIMLLYNDQHLDLHLNYIAEQGALDPDYQGLVNLIRANENLSNTPKNSPLRQYSKYFTKLSLQEFPYGGLLIYDTKRVFIPKNQIPKMIEILPSFHQTAGQMVLMARQYIFFPKIQQHLEEFSKTCNTCTLYMKSKDPSLQLIQTAELTKPLDCIVADWGTRGKLHFLIMADRATGFLWAAMYHAMTTDNTINLLKKIIVDFGKPIELTSDGGPAFQGKFSQFCAEKYIFHRHSTAYMPSHNGAAEISIRKVKLLIQKNPIRSKRLFVTINTNN